MGSATQGSQPGFCDGRRPATEPESSSWPGLLPLVSAPDDVAGLETCCRSTPNGDAGENHTESPLERPEQTVASEVVKSGKEDVCCTCLLRPLEGAFRVVLSRISIGSFFRRRLGRAGARKKNTVLNDSMFLSPQHHREWRPTATALATKMTLAQNLAASLE
jgi:hypothetical protein